MAIGTRFWPCEAHLIHEGRLKYAVAAWEEEQEAGDPSSNLGGRWAPVGEGATAARGSHSIDRACVGERDVGHVIASESTRHSAGKTTITGEVRARTGDVEAPVNAKLRASRVARPRRNSEHSEEGVERGAIQTRPPSSVGFMATPSTCPWAQP